MHTWRNAVCDSRFCRTGSAGLRPGLDSRGGCRHMVGPSLLPEWACGELFNRVGSIRFHVLAGGIHADDRELVSSGRKRYIGVEQIAVFLKQFVTVDPKFNS